MKTSSFTGFVNELATAHLLFVNDGSTDDTGTIIDTMAAKSGRIACLHLNSNMGKGEAIRQGMLRAFEMFGDCQWYGYWDADLATPLKELYHFQTHITESHKLVMGTRLNRLGASVKRHPMRHYLSRIMATLISMTLKIPVYDSQCGAKIIRAETAKQVFVEHFCSKWLFDVELIARILQLSQSTNLEQFCEVPVERWVNAKNSKLSISAMFKSLFDLYQIHQHYKL